MITQCNHTTAKICKNCETENTADVSESSLNSLLTSWRDEVKFLKKNIKEHHVSDEDKIFREGRIDAIEDLIEELEEAIRS